MTDTDSVRMLKYCIARDLTTTIVMGAGAIIRHVGIQRAGEICLWAEVPPGQGTEVRRFLVVGTGQPMQVPPIYRGTVFEGEWVWHVYEVSGGS